MCNPPVGCEAAAADSRAARDAVAAAVAASLLLRTAGESFRGGWKAVEVGAPPPAMPDGERRGEGEFMLGGDSTTGNNVFCI